MILSHFDSIRAVFRALDGSTIVDVGCGESRLPQELAGLGAECTGIDPFMPACDWQTEGSGRWRIQSRGADSLPFADCTVDGVLFIFSLHHVPGAAQMAAFREARRVLRPGGRLYVAEPLAEGDFNEVMKLFHDEAKVRAEAQAALVAARTLFTTHVASSYVERRHFKDFAAFAGPMQASTRFNDYATDDVVAPAVRARFEAIAGRTGGVFDQPVKVDILA